MVWGMTLGTFTAVHVVLSLVGIGAGLIVMIGLLTAALLAVSAVALVEVRKRVSGTTGWSQWVRSGRDAPDVVAQRDPGTIPGTASVN